ncbi:MAG TPA: ester cyclase [Pyrinomonadaceae bacterium]|jgi:steroid delta-isomerase-like uncharacterized protein
MSAEENKAVVRRFYEELWNARRMETADEIFAEECVTHQLQSGAEVTTAGRSPAALKRHVAEWLEGFPDLRFEVEQMIAEGTEVLSRSVMRGTHAGRWMGVAASHREVSIRMMVVHRIEGGKIVEDWVLVESLGFLQQLGLVPPTVEILSKAAK